MIKVTIDRQVMQNVMSGVADQLKNKIIKVIIIVLIVKFFEKILKYSESFSSTTDILYFGLSILSICVGYYLLNRK